jgi:pyruvate-ferredoxin/flavodoxin oxidoreductase
VIGGELSASLLETDQTREDGITTQRAHISKLRSTLIDALSKTADPNTQHRISDLFSLADAFVRKSVWIVGGDGWAYDIGYGGLDHVLASGRDVNILVLDTEVYSNTGGQMSKSTPRAAVAKFAASGKPLPKKDLAMLAMTYGNAYVARIGLGANDAQTVKAFLEAESFPGPSLIIAYSPCIAHGYDLKHSLNQTALAVSSGYWPLYRFDPRRGGNGDNRFQLDSKAPSVPLKDYVYNETRYTMLVQSDPERAKTLLAEAQRDVESNWEKVARLAQKEK